MWQNGSITIGIANPTDDEVQPSDNNESVGNDSYMYVAHICNPIETFICSEKAQKIQVCQTLCPYLKSALKMHQNDYKQAYVWSSGS